MKTSNPSASRTERVVSKSLTVTSNSRRSAILRKIRIGLYKSGEHDHPGAIAVPDGWRARSAGCIKTQVHFEQALFLETGSMGKYMVAYSKRIRDEKFDLFFTVVTSLHRSPKNLRSIYYLMFIYFNLHMIVKLDN
jgi:hypothetical protein